MFLFYVLSIFKNGDTIQGGTLFKGGHYLRKLEFESLVLTTECVSSASNFVGFLSSTFFMKNVCCLILILYTKFELYTKYRNNYFYSTFILYLVVHVIFGHRCNSCSVPVPFVNTQSKRVGRPTEAEWAHNGHRQDFVCK